MVQILSAGDNVVDCYRSLGRMFPGGNCVNVAVFARRCGAGTGYLGSVGPDAAGELIRTALLQESVDVARLKVRQGRTASCLIGHVDGDRVFLGQDLGVSRFVADSADLAYAAGFDAVHIGQSSGLDAQLDAFAAAAPLSFDFSTERDPVRLAEVAPRCLLASFSGGDLDDEDAGALADRATGAGARWALVTRGPRGAILSNGRRHFETAAAPGGICDTLGAGDTFIARTLVGILQQEDPAVIMADAARRAARTCSHHGAFGYGSTGVEAVLRSPGYAAFR